MNAIPLLALLLTAPGPLIVPGGTQGTVSGDIYTNGNEVCAYNETTDAAPDTLILKSGDCYAQGTQTASSLVLAGGLDEKKITVTNTAISALDTITQTVNGTALAALVDGTAWTACAGETTTVCADRIATAIQAQAGSGVVCDNVAAVVYCQPVSCSTYAWSSASADGAADGAAWTSSNGTDGQVLVPRGSITIPSISTSGDTDTGLSWPAANTLRFLAGGTAYKLDIAPTIITMGVTLDMLTSKVYNSGGMLDLGGAVTSTHALDATVGSVGISGALEVDGALYADLGTYLVDGAALVLGTGSDATIAYWAAQTPDALIIGVGADSNGLIVSEKADVAYDFAHAQEADPTIFLQSHSQSATNFLKFQHDDTNGRISAGAGSIVGNNWTSTPQTVTCADSGDGNHSTCGGAVTLTSNVVQLVCSDAHGCTLTLAETGYSATVSGQVVLLGPAANHVDVADSAGVLETAGGAAMAMDALDTLSIVYSPLLWWAETSRAAN